MVDFNSQALPGKEILITQRNQSQLHMSDRPAPWSREQNEEWKMNLKGQMEDSLYNAYLISQNSFQVYY